jgi:hypothetical protein
MGSGVFWEEGNIDMFDPNPSYLLLPPNPLAYRRSLPVCALLAGAQSCWAVSYLRASRSPSSASTAAPARPASPAATRYECHESAPLFYGKVQDKGLSFDLDDARLHG